MISAYNRIYLKVTYTVLLLYYPWTFIYGSSIDKNTSSLIAAASAVILLVLMAKIGIEPFACLFVVVNVTIDRFMTDNQTNIHLHSSCYLFWGPVFFELGFYITLYLGMKTVYLLLDLCLLLAAACAKS